MNSSAPYRRHPTLIPEMMDVLRPAQQEPSPSPPPVTLLEMPTASGGLTATNALLIGAGTFLLSATVAFLVSLALAGAPSQTAPLNTSATGVFSVER